MSIINSRAVFSLCNENYILINIGYYNGLKMSNFNDLEGFNSIDEDNSIYDYSYLFLEKDNKLFRFYILENLSNKKYICNIEKVNVISDFDFLFLRSYDKENNKIIFNIDLFYSMFSSLRCLIRDSGQEYILDYDSIIKSKNKLNSFFNS